MLFYFSEKSNLNANTLTAESASTREYRKGSATRKRVKTTSTKGKFLNSTQEKRDPIAFFLKNGNTLVSGGPPALVSRKIERQRS